MKKIFLVLLLISILIMPVFVLAKTPAPNCKIYCADQENYSSPSGQVCICNPISAPDFETLINNIINFIYWIVIAAAPLAIIIGGAYFLTAGGKPENVETGKRIITYTIIGLAIVLLARGLTAVITGVLGG